MQEHTLEAIKEFIRVIILSALPVIIMAIESGDFSKPTIIAIVVALLRGLDSWVHENPNIDSKGISPI